MSRPPRIPGFSYVGPYRYFLTFCTKGRRETFRSPEIVELTMTQIRRSTAECSFSLLAYCVMPDHMHLMVEGTTDVASLRLFVKRAKQRSGRAYLAQRGGPLWQEGYFDRVLRPGDDAKALARYIVANPVRAHLVAHPLEYPYSGSDVWPLRDLCEDVMW